MDLSFVKDLPFLVQDIIKHKLIMSDLKEHKFKIVHKKKEKKTKVPLIIPIIEQMWWMKEHLGPYGWSKKKDWLKELFEMNQKKFYKSYSTKKLASLYLKW
tara:strand:+ start:10968 stop:11270 length:303 start_codon:yes stop_codon:yes gene_type:complete